jgi:hypothetical protein
MTSLTSPKILSRIVQNTLETAKDITIDSETKLNFTALATQTEGYSALDLQDLVARAIHQVAIRAASNNSDSVTKLFITKYFPSNQVFHRQNSLLLILPLLKLITFPIH